MNPDELSLDGKGELLRKYEGLPVKIIYNFLKNTSIEALMHKGNHECKI